MVKIYIPKDRTYAPKEMVEDGLYFRDSMCWYMEKFVHPLTISFSYVVFCLLYLVTLVLSLFLILEMFPLKEKRVMIIPTKREAGTVIKFNHLKRYKSPTENILMSLVEHYVKQRENYILEEFKTTMNVLKQKQQFIMKTSSKQVYNKFTNWVKKYNSITGDFLIANVETRIVINSSHFEHENSSILGSIRDAFLPVILPKKAIINFTSVNSKGRERHFRAYISYAFRMNKQGNSSDDLRFRVLSYKVTKV